jgi:flagellar hook-length control protein FliK
MNVAQGTATQAAKSGAAGTAHHARGKGLSGVADDGSEGFLSLISALGADDASSTLPGKAKGADDPSSLTANPVTGANAVPVDTSVVANGLTAADALTSAAQSASGNLATAAQGDANPVLTGVTGLQAGTRALAGQAVQAGTTLLGGKAADALVAGSASDVAGPADGPRAPRRASDGKGDLLRSLKAQAQALATGTDGSAAGAPGQVGGAAEAAAAKAKDAALAKTMAGKPSEVQQADSKLAAELRAGDVARQAESAAQRPAAPEVQMLAAAVDGAGREVLRAAERSAGKLSGLLDQAQPGQPVVAASATYDKPSATVDTTAIGAPPEVQVAEQLSYWVSRDVHNAELKLDGLANNPVEVSISLVGNEAHVAFRSDQPEVRQVLENAMPHLKDMLQKEGLTLAGTTVGSSGQGGQPSGQEQRGRDYARQARVALANLAPAQAARRLDATLGGAVDYFV